MRFNLRSLITVSLAILASCGDDMSADNFSGTGQGGSMTRFAINGNHMYVVDNSSILVFNISAGNFQQVENVPVGFGVETIFSKGEYLYLGANDAMYIYSITNADLPTFIFRYQHIVACDPVVVQGNRAYVTLRITSTCNRGADQLEIIDISDPYAPKLVRSYPMTSPHGLAVDDNLLFLCHGEAGLRVYDISNENNIQQVPFLGDFFAYDVILKQGLATVTGEDGIFQFTYNHSGTITLISKISVTRGAL